MAELKLVARIDEEGTGRESFLVRAPAVGIIDGVPALGHYANPMESFAVLRILSQRHPILLPRGVGGRVAERFVEGSFVGVEYNQPLFRLRQGLDAAAEAEARSSAGRTDVEGDLIAVPAPSDGIFYRRPSPDSPAYVDVGDEVHSGSVLGLVEVMKSFNQILYGGPGFPARGTVARIEADDSAEVQLGKPLFYIKPLD